MKRLPVVLHLHNRAVLAELSAAQSSCDKPTGVPRQSGPPPLVSTTPSANVSMHHPITPLTAYNLNLTPALPRVLGSGRVGQRKCERVLDCEWRRAA